MYLFYDVEIHLTARAQFGVTMPGGFTGQIKSVSSSLSLSVSKSGSVSGSRSILIGLLSNDILIGDLRSTSDAPEEMTGDSCCSTGIRGSSTILSGVLESSSFLIDEYFWSALNCSTE